jgi:CrcB protein
VITAAAFGLAAGLGAVGRAWSCARVGRPFGVALGTVAVNVGGSFALGLLAGVSATTATVLGTGLLGTFTTFSGFAHDTVALWQEDRPGVAVLYAAGSCACGLAAAALGLAIAG